MSPRHRAGAAAITGGGALIIGAWMPWMSLFAGLYPLRGVIGLNGRLVLAAGIVVVALGGVLMTRDVRSAPRVLHGLGVALMGLSVWIVIGVRQLTAAGGHHAMLAVQQEAGIYVVLAGAAVTATAPFLARSRSS